MRQMALILDDLATFPGREVVEPDHQTPRHGERTGLAHDASGHPRISDAIAVLHVGNRCDGHKAVVRAHSDGSAAPV